MINEEIGFSKDAFDTLVSEVGLKSIYEYVTRFGTGMSSVCHYVDECGNFTLDRNHLDRIAIAYYKTLSSKEKLVVLEYIEDFANAD